VAKIVIDSFGGMIPRTSPRMLPNSQAAFAANAKLTNGALRGFRASLEGQQLTPYFVGDVRRAFPIYDVTDDALLWFARPDPDASVVGPAVLGDQHQRHYFTEPGERPRYFRLADFRADEASSFRELGVPRGNPAVVVPSGGSAANETRSYVYTLVGPNGEEGAPSDPFTVAGKPDGTWTVSGWSTATTQDGKVVAKVNVYRTIPGRTTADFFRVASVTLPTASYVDSRPGIEVVLEPLLESDGWDPPPEDLQGLVRHSGGFLAGFVGRDVYFSMPYRPHAWPPEYAVTLRHEVVALAPLADAILALTKGPPVALVGTRPDAVTPVDFSEAEPCMSARSVVPFDNAILYASPNGIVAAGLSQLQLATGDLVTREEWGRDYAPSEIVACRYGPYYIAAVGPSRGFAFASGQEPASLVRLDRLRNLDGLETDPRTGKAYLIQGSQLFEFDARDDSRQQLTWVSKEFVFPRPINMGALTVYWADEEGVAEEQEPAEGTDELDAAAEAWNGDRFGAGVLAPLGSSVLGGHAVSIPLRRVEGNGYSVVPPIEPLGGVPLFTLDEEGGGGVIPVEHVYVRVVADGRVRWQGTVADQRIRKLPSGYKARVWQLEVATNKTVHAIMLGETVKEIAGAS
jgi:hypothetical protein